MEYLTRKTVKKLPNITGRIANAKVLLDEYTNRMLLSGGDDRLFKFECSTEREAELLRQACYAYQRRWIREMQDKIEQDFSVTAKQREESLEFALLSPLPSVSIRRIGRYLEFNFPLRITLEEIDKRTTTGEPNITSDEMAGLMGGVNEGAKDRH